MLARGCFFLLGGVVSWVELKRSGYMSNCSNPMSMLNYYEVMISRRVSFGKAFIWCAD